MIKRRLLCSALVFSGMFLFFMFWRGVPNAQAVQVFVQGRFVNNGVTNVTVSYAYSDAAGYWYSSPTSPKPLFGGVPAGTTVGGDYAQDISGAGPPHSVWWSTNCYDPVTGATASFTASGLDYVEYTAVVDVTCPAPPTGLAASCDANNNLTFSWNPTVSTRYAIRIDDTADGWIGPLDTVDDNVPSASYTRSGIAGHTYTWWMNTIYNNIWSNQANGPNVTCAASAGSINGYKGMGYVGAFDWTSAPPASQTVRLNGGSANVANPYYYPNLSAGTYTVAVDTIPGWATGYTLCAPGDTSCHTSANLQNGSSVSSVTVEAGKATDLWWHFTKPPASLTNNSPPCMDLASPVTFSWAGSPGAASYNLRVGATNYTAGGTSYAVTLIPNTPYTWGVKATNAAGGQTSETAGSGFTVPSCSKPDLTTTINCPGVLPNVAFTCTGGVNNKTSIATSSGGGFITIWQRVNPGGGATLVQAFTHADVGANTTEPVTTHVMPSISLPQGTYTLYFCADQSVYNSFGGSVIEASETNNCSTVQLNVYPKRTPPCDSIGDVSQDGWVWGDDANLVLNYTAGLASLTAEQQRRADVNGDGQVDSIDLLLILQFVNGTNSSFPICVNPSAPTTLTVSVGPCSSGAPAVTFNWTPVGTLNSSFRLAVKTSAWLAGDADTAGGYKDLGAVSTFTWSSASQLASGSPLSPAASGATYYWRIRSTNSNTLLNSPWAYPPSPAGAPSAIPGTSFFTTSCVPPADPSNLSVTTSCPSGVLTVAFAWTDNATNETGYYLDVTTGGNATTWASTWGYKTLGVLSGSGSFIWKDTATASDQLTAPDADPNTAGNQVRPGYGNTYRWRVVAFNANAYSNHIYPANTQSPTGTAFTTPSSASCSPPPNPSNLSVTMTCPSGLPSLLFSWTDNATNDTEYYVDINGAAWTGDATPSPWGVKTLAGNGVATGTMSWTWSSTAPVDTGGDTDPVTAGNQLTPQNNKQYYWRVIARNTSTSPALYSSHVYPNGGAGTTVWPGTAVNANCSPNLVVTAFSIPNGDVGSAQTASVTVQNAGLSSTAVGFSVGVKMNSASITCGTADYSASTLALGAGASAVVPVQVFLPATMNTYTASAMADSGSPCPNGAVTETNENDNTMTTTYQAQGFDLSTTVLGLDKDPASYKDNQTAYFKIQVTNNGNITSPVSGINLGVWPKGGTAGGDTTSYPSCPGPGSTAPTDPAGKVQTYSVGTLNPGQTVLFDGTVDPQYSFNVGQVPGSFTLKSYVMYNCAAAGNDANWANNGSECVSPCVNLNKTYSVVVDSFFDASGGDVGSQGNISVSRTPVPAGHQQSNYLAAATTLTNVQSPWQITNYNQRQVPTIVYPYLKEVFYQKASRVTSNCTFSTYLVGPNYCSGNATLDGSHIPTGVSYWFIDGSLDITNDVKIPSSSAALVIVVRDDVTIETNVKQVDAVIVAGQTFHAQSSGSNFVGAQLTINGAVYTNQSDLSRVLGGGAGVCGSICDNALYPAIVFNLDPKYMVLLTPPLGTPAIGWKEVNP